MSDCGPIVYTRFLFGPPFSGPAFSSPVNWSFNLGPALGSTWGINPKICHWIYIAIIRPMITHAAVVWWLRVELGVARVMLSRV